MRLTYLKVSNFRALMQVEIPVSMLVCVVGENNSGKSSLLRALKALLENAKLDAADFYNPNVPVEITGRFEGVSEEDIALVPEAHRDRIRELITDGRIELLRRFAGPAEAPSLLYLKKQARDLRLRDEQIGQVLQGKSGAQVREAMKTHLPEYGDHFEGATTQAVAKERVNAIVKGLPDAEKVALPSPIPTGIPQSLSLILPEPIFIEAVKDINDDTKTKDSATFGKLLGWLLSEVSDTEEIQTVKQALETLKPLLNPVLREDGTRDETQRLAKVKELELVLGGFVRENFPSATTTIEIPPPEIKQIFGNARILIDDGVNGEVWTKGDGIKRVVMFSLLRALERLRKDRTDSLAQQRYILLFEEPELYLYPAAQQVLFNALQTIAEQNTVVVSTHSPVFFTAECEGTFIKLRKHQERAGAAPVTKSMAISLSLPEMKDAARLICYENNSAAFFSDIVLLAEGESDTSFFRHISKVLDGRWEFDRSGIPLIQTHGKGNIAKYRMFFSAFGICVHTITDLDVLVRDFDKIGADQDSADTRSTLLSEVDQIIAGEGLSATFASKDVQREVSTYSWSQKWERAKAIVAKAQEGGSVTKDEVLGMSLLFAREKDLSRQNVLRRAIPTKDLLLAKLREQNIYVLGKGSLEDYYPAECTGREKPDRAKRACELLQSREAFAQICPIVEDGGRQCLEMEAIFSRVFQERAKEEANHQS